MRRGKVSVSKKVNIILQNIEVLRFR